MCFDLPKILLTMEKMLLLIIFGFSKHDVQFLPMGFIFQFSAANKRKWV